MFSFLKNLFSREEKSDTVYVGNLNYTASTNDLRSLFDNAGDIKNVRIIRDTHTRKSKGFGFVTFANAKEANTALSFEGKSIKGRPVRVRIAKSRPREE